MTQSIGARILRNVAAAALVAAGAQGQAFAQTKLVLNGVQPSDHEPVMAVFEVK